MKRKILLLGVVLALILTMVMPFSIIGAKPAPLSCAGSILGITPGIVAPAGTLVSNPLIMANNSQSGQWRVIDRQIIGAFGLDATVPGYFILNYKGVFELFTQEGNFHGQLTSGDYVFEVNGKASPIDYSTMFAGGLPVQTISGHWTCLNGTWGTGTFDASVSFMVDLETGHIVGVDQITSTFEMNSK
jgi:hypothetical protein